MFKNYQKTQFKHNLKTYLTTISNPYDFAIFERNVSELIEKDTFLIKIVFSPGV